MDSEALAARVENALRDAGLEPLVDDREESAGVKFNDADLIGLPLRITVSERSFRAGGLEIKPRRGGETVVVPMENLVVEVQRLLNALEEPL